MKSAEQSSDWPCPFEAEIPAYLQDELSAGERLAYEAHAATCTSCADNIIKYRQLVRLLREPLTEEPVRDLAPDILARIQPVNRDRSFFLQPAFLRVAAVFVCIVVAGTLVRVLRPQPLSQASHDPRIDAALHWLHSTQQPEGCWDAARWGAQKNYAPGITGLAILAFLKHDAGALNGPHAEAIRRGLDYLVRQQNAEGRIGILCSGTPYNEGMGTLALLEACTRQKNAQWEQTAERGLKYIRNAQLASGGWGYPRTPGDSGNTSVTVWQLQALFKAEAMGRSDVRATVAKGMAWLDKVVDPDGTVGYSRPRDFPNGHETLTAAGALCFLTDKGRSGYSSRLVQTMQALRDAARQTADVDYYRLYFMTQALMSADHSDEELVTKLRETVLSCQAQTGADAGSFEAMDRWSKAGGRVYATAMAVLAL